MPRHPVKASYRSPCCAGVPTTAPRPPGQGFCLGIGSILWCDPQLQSLVARPLSARASTPCIRTSSRQVKFTRPSRPLIALILGSLAIVVCYFFIDRPVAWCMHEHRFYPDTVLFWPPFVSDRLGYLAIAGIVAMAAWRLWRPGGRLQTLLLAIAATQQQGARTW